ncbi:TonB-dependent receptor [Novosphingobium nitrogenifigens DSM 19370]|uniref:TonB-dependent receptor n=1 Tax=Novosphingobium nitrogenifigens DSM 19370 TaxID=983920 RepID=F1ZAU7_9SPHN|nr:TonB-dependent receptor [Novosphingobium nitrogenifigens]EGD58275.1 TonB-dependent receptor [Novosphingobium nitrogenifigens DSM 19370]
MQDIDRGSLAASSSRGKAARADRLRAIAIIALAGTALGGAIPSTAQAAEAPQPAATETGGTPDIVVTAQRREQRVQDVGIAVSVLSNKDLSALNINNASDLVRAVPNLHYNAYASSQVVFNIRGVSQNDYGDQQEPPVAVYQDDSYASSISTASFPIFDLARTEALRGPQGTLFGRNATGGAVQFISNMPTHRLEGYFSAQYGRYNQSILEGAISGGLTSNLTERLSGIYDRDDGYLKNITPGQPDRGGNNHWALRSITQWDPSSDFRARLTLRYGEADHERQASMYSLSPACPNAQLQGEFLAANQVCEYWNNYYGTSYNGGVPGSTANGYTNPAISPSQGGDPWKTAGTGDSYVDRKMFAATLRLEAKAGPFDIVSISDYQYLKKYYQEVGDGDPEIFFPEGTALAPYTTAACPSPAQSVTCYASGSVFIQGSSVNQYTQELRASTKFGKNYLVFGGFGMILDGKYYAKFATPFDQYDPAVHFSQRTTSFAFFAQDEFKFNDQWKVIGGLRYWHDHKRGDYHAYETISGLTLNWGPGGISFYDPTGVANSADITVSPSAATPSFSGVTARAEIDYKPGRDTLIYFSYNRGSKSGGFTFSTGTPYPGVAITDTINNIPYRPETLNDYEIGLKTKIGRHVQFNLAAFYYDYQNYQAFVQVGYTQVVRNLPATIKGIEADFTVHPIPGLTIQASGALQDSEVKGVVLPDGVTVVNHNLPQAPGFSGNGLIRYEFPLAGGNASVQADALYTGKFCFTVMCAPVEQEGSYHVENARIGFTPKGGRLDLAFFVNNIFNRAYRTYAFDSSLYWGDSAGVYAKPRTWGISAKIKFGG